MSGWLSRSTEVRVRVAWVPFSASGLVAGAAALFAGAVATPVMADDGDALTLVRFEDERWLVVGTLYFAAACALTMGLPSILTLFRRRNRLGLVAIGVFVIGCLGIAGYAMLLFFMRALAVTHAAAGDLSAVVEEPALLGFLYGWAGALYLGELLLAIALLRHTSTPRWIPFVLIGHVASLPLSAVLPESAQVATALLITAGLGGLGVFAVRHHRRFPQPV
jgi:hypothetical protein